MLRVLHPNRWLFWTIAIAISVALYLLSYIKDAEMEFLDNSIVIDMPTWHSWKSEALGMSVRYPAGWQIELDASGEHAVFFENPDNFNENISVWVRAPSMEQAVRDTLENYQESEIMVDGEIGRWFKASNRNDSARNNVILVRHDRQLYYIAGAARNLKQILNSIRFL